MDLQGLLPIQYLPAMPLEALREQSSKIYVRKGEELLAPGIDSPDKLFLLSGRLIFQKSGEVIDSSYRAALQSRYSKGDVLLTDTDCCVVKVNAELLDKLLCWAQASQYLEVDLAQQLNSEDDSRWMRTLLHSNLFLKVSPVNIDRLLGRLVATPVKSGEVVLRQGDVGDGCYFIKQGRASVTRKVEEQKEVIELAEIGYGRCFGEDALVYEKARNATVTMLSDGLLMKMEKRDFLELLREPTVSTITAMDLEMALGTSARLLDVRTLEEFEIQHLTGSLHMPLNVLRSMESLLDKHLEYIVYCDTGRRSRAAVFFLEHLGYRARALVGGMGNLTEQQASSLIESHHKASA